MLMVPPNLGTAPARRGAPAASIPTAALANTSRRVNGAPPAGTTVPAPETNKAMILLLAAPLMEPCEKCIPGMRACQHYPFGELPKDPTVRSGGKWRLLTLPGDPGGVGQCRKRGMKTSSRRQGRVAAVGPVTRPSPRRTGMSETRHKRPFAGRTARPDPQETFLATPADRRVGQKAVIGVRLFACRRPAHVNSSSSPFASFRSAVLKPSRNQP